MNRERVLIIKHGFSETCDHHISPVVSFGDVFRCTCLLEDFKGSHVTWITARSAYDLLAHNHLIDRLVLADSPNDLPAEGMPDRFDTIINLEKQKDWCEFAASMSAKQQFGFRDWSSTGPEAFYPASAAALADGLGRENYRPLQETLFQLIGREWSGQRYHLGYRPKVVPIYDVGLNHRVGPKWPTKVWPEKKWKQLYRELNKKYAISWQQSLNSIRHYIDWLSSCRLVVTSDSLGLHLCLALDSRVVALFGPTAAEQVYLYGQGIKLTPQCDRRCIPCFRSSCDYNDTCMDYISVGSVIEAVDMLLEGRPAIEKSTVQHRETQTPIATGI
jgi:heptosyltransferase II